MNQFYNGFPEGNSCQFLPAGTEFSKYWKWKGNSSLELEMICSSSVIRIFSSVQKRDLFLSHLYKIQCIS